MDYKEKKAIADAYLIKKAGVDWDELSDINSLHDCDTQEDVFAACDDRLEEDGFPMDDIGPTGDINDGEDDNLKFIDF
jgi:hypothetical protein